MLVVVAITVETHFSRFSGVVRAPESRLIVAAMLDLQNLRELVLKSKMAATAFTQPKKKKKCAHIARSWNCDERCEACKLDVYFRVSW